MKPYVAGYKVRVTKQEILRPWIHLFSFVGNFKYHLYDPMTFRFSTSIQNFADRVKNKHGVYEWSFWESLFDPTAFIGLYHPGDWLRILVHRGPKLAFWCGSDILRLQGRYVWQWLLRHSRIDHVCENEVEQEVLREMGFEARIHPILFFDDWSKYPLSFKPSKKPHVWLTCHPGREEEYGVTLIEEVAHLVPEVVFHIFGGFGKKWPVIQGVPRQPSNIHYYGWTSPEKVDEVIKRCHAGFRANEFDGCPHVVTKGMLLGQWTISRIPYPHCATYKTREELIKLLKGLKYKKKPNIEGRKHWLDVLNKFPWS